MWSLDDEILAAGCALARFHRWFTDGVREAVEGLSYSATEGWVVFELARQDVIEVTSLRRRLGIDPGYLSRVLSRLQAARLITRQRAPADARCQTVRLTTRGLALSHAIDAHLAQAVRGHLAELPNGDQRRVIDAMVTIRQAMSAAP
ncbi:MarR family winged helix-turn-helix transcriptional regulator [Nonomuraea diastatica]|uniref:MarR family transcriptional regulator n=1 Tax=Nonomuraea diastatica TaxID=1848329 RepID=A0A4R4X382_9ACTN|nr:MarR family winged helix-turn-helix transcriptional regulator [Nonomuraea diastatica]TDD24731.1 MarR family transcriptional regulator [Nonomuraea diastatica]